MSSVSFQAGFEMSEDGKNRASSVVNDPNWKTKVYLKSLKMGRTVHHLLQMTQLMLEDQGVFKILEDGKNRASSVANDPTHVGRSVLVRLKRAVTKLVRLKCLRLNILNFIRSRKQVFF